MTVDIECVRLDLERLRARRPRSRSHTNTPLEKELGEMLAKTSSFDTLDLLVAILEAHGLGADTDERREIAEALGWPVSNALRGTRIGGWRDGYAMCKDDLTRRLFG